MGSMDDMHGTPLQGLDKNKSQLFSQPDDEERMEAKTIEGREEQKSAAFGDMSSVE